MEEGRPSYFSRVVSIFLLLLLSSFFPCLFSAVGDWMSTILLHMVWPEAVKTFSEVRRAEAVET